MKNNSKAITGDILLEMQDEYYLKGEKAVWQQFLQLALTQLGYQDYQAEHLIKERVRAIEALREICGEFGDNDWSDNLHLADIIEKHLRKHLELQDTDEELKAKLVEIGNRMFILPIHSGTNPVVVKELNIIRDLLLDEIKKLEKD